MYILKSTCHFVIAGPRFNYMSRGAMIGRFPIRLIGDKVCFLSRTGKSIYVHCSTKEEKFKRLAEIQVRPYHNHIQSEIENRVLQGFLLFRVLRLIPHDQDSSTIKNPILGFSRFSKIYPLLDPPPPHRVYTD